MSATGTGPTILITGAAGNLGGILARHLAAEGHRLQLMVHRTPLHPELEAAPKVRAIRADLSRPETLAAAVAGSDVVVHFAGVLFAPRPERFLPTTNTLWFSNLTKVCLEQNVRRLVLISFPHVEGPTSVEAPASGRLDREPVSVHARTRLAQERLLFERTRGTQLTPVVLRVGMVYGRGILMIEAARWLARHRLLTVWREPTWIHLISKDDFITATTAAIVRPEVQGIYHLGDEQPVTLQQFLDKACAVWRLPKPYRLPVWMIYSAAQLCEGFALVTGRPAPLTRDFITIGRVPYFGDTRRARKELIEALRYPSLDTGTQTL